MVDSDRNVDTLYLDFQLALAGRYSIDRELGRGGMGVVYLAREVHLDRLVAIKLLPPERAAEPGRRERFLREARLAAKLSHPNIIPIHAVDEVDGFVFFVMSFVDGETLAQRVRSRGPMPASEGTRVLREVAWALAYAHSQGLVHRDVKPDNILIEAGSGRALVADFGIAAAEDDLGTDGVAGTPEFMSPEQALGQPVDARSDLYSLGATAFYAFSGRLVFEGRNATEVLAKQVTEPAPTMASLGVSVPRRLGAMIDRCLAKDPAHRPRDAGALAEQLAAALELRREVPAALRHFVKRMGRVDGAGTLLGSIGLLVGAVATSVYLGPLAGFTAFFLGGTVAPLAYLVNSARKLVAVGFTHRDLEPAFRGEIEVAREERSAERSTELQRGTPRIDRGLRLVVRASGVLAGATLATLFGAAWLGMNGIIQNVLAPTFVGSNTVFLFSGIGYIVRLQRTRDADTEFWAMIWLGRIGRSLFGLARRLTRTRDIGAAMTHRATELALGLAAEQLFERLPKETRDALGDLPKVLQRLQENAGLLRVHHDALADALSDAGDAGDSADYAELRALRDEAREKQADAVGALETIRLNLLRLHAGSATVEGLTTHLGLAAEVAAEVERIIESRAEVERALRFPREIAPTPA